MPIDEILEFKARQQKFLKWVPYMTKKRNTVKDLKDQAWLDVIKNFTEKIEQPFDAAWDRLTTDEKRQFMPAEKNRQQMVFENCPF